MQPLVNETNKPFIASLQALRFLAAAMVLFAHLKIELRSHHFGTGIPFADATRINWSAGVDIFFVISGFIMFYLMHGKFGQRGVSLDFLKHRFIRVVPLYWLYISIFIAINLFLGGIVGKNDTSLTSIITTYLFIAWPKADGTFKPVLGPGWTLNCEIFFYLLFAVALRFPKRIGVSLLIATFVALTGYGLIVQSSLPFQQHSYLFYTRPVLLEFLYGVGVAFLYVRGFRLSQFWRWLLIVGGVVLLGVIGNLGGFGNPNTRFLGSGIPALLIVSGGVLGRDFSLSGPWARFAVLGGNISYSLYLCHLFAMRPITLVWQKLHLPGGWLFMICAFMLTLGASCLAYLFVEQPLLRVMRSLFLRNEPQTDKSV